MPAREMYFTFDTDVEINKETVNQFVEDFKPEIKKYFKEIKKEFKVDSIDETFLKEFIIVLSKFDCDSMDDDDIYGKDRIVKNFIYNKISSEMKNPETVLKIRYLNDKWDYEGCGSDDYYYLTFTDIKKSIDRMTKEIKKSIKKLESLGAEVTFEVKYL